MDTRRVILYAALAFVVYSLWMNWQKDYPAVLPQSVSTEQSSVLPMTDNNQMLPTVSDEGSSDTVMPVNKDETTPTTSSKPIMVQTDVFNVLIDPTFGDITSAKLLDYPLSVEDRKPFPLLFTIGSDRYVANSSLFTVSGQKIDTLAFNFTSKSSTYEFEPGQKQLVVTLEGKTPEGLQVNKEFIFKKGSYLIEMRYKLANAGSAAWKGYLNTQLLRTTPQEDKSSMFHIGSYTGASYANPGKHRYQKVTFKDMTKGNLEADAQGGWVAMQQHYFLSSWIPEANSKNKFYTRANNGDFTIGAVSQPIELSPGDKEEIGSSLYLGPEITSTLKAISPGLDMTVDYGWLWFLSSALFSIMKAIYNVLGNWGWSIVLVTLLIKLAFYRLSATSYKSMAGMRKLQPKLQELRERYGNDKAKISQGTMELYRQEKVNPLGGCLPIVIQIPVFIALYWVLIESVELRQAPFIFWIQDLAAADPYHVLPIIMGATMLIQQRLNPAPPDPTQAKVMMFLPIMFTALFWGFPSGLVLYWIVNNSLSILQQWYITRKYSDKPVKLATVAK